MDFRGLLVRDSMIRVMRCDGLLVKWISICRLGMHQEPGSDFHVLWIFLCVCEKGLFSMRLLLFMDIVMTVHTFYHVYNEDGEIHIFRYACTVKLPGFEKMDIWTSDDWCFCPNEIRASISLPTPSYVKILHTHILKPKYKKGPMAFARKCCKGKTKRERGEGFYIHRSTALIKTDAALIP